MSARRMLCPLEFAVLAEISRRLFSDLRIVLKGPEPPIAFRTKKLSYLTGAMVMVDMKMTARAALIDSTYPT